MNNKFDFSRLFYNEKFLVIFSVVLAFIIWVCVSMSSNGPDTNITIDNIPIDIQLSQSAQQDNLRVFELENQDVANVAVTGNSLVLGSLDSSSILVTSNQASTITEPGQYELNLVAKQNDGNKDFSISQESLYPQKVTVTVDKYKEATYQISDNTKYKIDSDYFAGSTAFDPQTVTISGPQTVMDKIAGVRVDYTINDTLTSSKTFTAPITVYDADDNVLSDADLSRLRISSNDVTATIQVLKRATLPLTASFTNVPEGLDIMGMTTVTPSTIDIAGPGNVISNMQSIILPSIDFSQINLDNTNFELKVPLPDSCKNLNNEYTTTVQIDMSNLEAATVNVTNFEIAGGKPGKIKTSSITVGPQDQIEALQDKDVVGEINLSNKNGVTGITEAPVQFKINGYDSCWVYGNYTANVEIK